MANDQPADAVAIVEAAFDAVETGDIETFRSFFSANATIWHNYDKKTMPIGAVADGLKALTQVAPGVRYADRRYVAVADGVVAEQVIRGVLRSGKRVEVHLMARLHMAGGKITHVDEYLDPAQSAPIVAEFA